ncbi:chaplin family protein [Streptomonospora nanhaiensis]|uniref:chaplin family protein n=2 Tax=Streptomonospora nanhaiensis TaxID=1323731 RepID=UPI001C389333|nr:chaplin family protein [Streptomonospora nanhaiensis]MBV2363876.1 chaplin [Streptomonospora nanhaiensis]MBX9388244.1 chaplin [Streptomonospora nanhaiensis]
MRKQYTYLTASLLTAGILGAAPAAALADPQTDGSGGVGSGNQVNVPADIRAQLCGNALSVLGISQADCDRVSEVLYAASDAGQEGPATDGSGGIASGNQINIPVDVALDICGNSAAIGGIAKADCTTVVEELAEESAERAPTTDGSGGIASGNQINIPVDVALDVCGNSIAVLGASSAQCTTIVNVIEESAESSGEGAPTTDGSGGVASGNQVNIPVNAAVDICENAVAVLGIAEPDCVEKISQGEPGAPGGGDGGEQPPGGGDEQRGETGDPGGEGGTPSAEPSPSPSAGTGPSPDDQAAPQPGDGAGAAGDLPLTGPALGGLVAAALAAIGGGAGAMYLTRRRRAAAGPAEDGAESADRD